MHLPLSARCGPLPAFGSQGSTATSSPRSPTLLATKVRGLASHLAPPSPTSTTALPLPPRLPNDSLALTLTLTLALALTRRAPWACRRTRWRRRLRSSSGARGRGGRRAPRAYGSCRGWMVDASLGWLTWLTWAETAIKYYFRRAHVSGSRATCRGPPSCAPSMRSHRAVSYTHLTLPTILLV